MSGENSPINSDNDESNLLKLALRLLDSEDPHSEHEAPTLYAGRLPESLTMDIPIPSGSEIVGSVERLELEGERSVEVVLDFHGHTEGFLDSYKELAVDAGWNEPPRREPEGGFAFGPATDSLLLCRGERGPALFVDISRPYKDDKHPADVRLRLLLDDLHSPCEPEPYEDDFERHIPQLVPPPDARQYPGGGGGGPNDAESHATLETELEVAVVGEHYARELTAAGWMRVEEGSSGPQAWSTWTFSDERDHLWKGVFTALKLPDSQRYFLQIHVHRSRGLNNT